MRTLYYVLLCVFLLLVLFCVNLVRWLISKSHLALLSVRLLFPRRSHPMGGESVRVR